MEIVCLSKLRLFQKKIAMNLLAKPTKLVKRFLTSNFRVRSVCCVDLNTIAQNLDLTARYATTFCTRMCCFFAKEKPKAWTLQRVEKLHHQNLQFLRAKKVLFAVEVFQNQKTVVARVKAKLLRQTILLTGSTLRSRDTNFRIYHFMNGSDHRTA